MELTITKVHDECLERLLSSESGSVQVGPTTSPAIVRGLHDLVYAGVIERHPANPDRYSIRTD